MTSKLFFILITILFSAGAALAQTASFTYQGKLNDGALPANGTYQFQFRLYDAASSGNQIGQTLTDVPATVTNGIFAVSLDFGVENFDGGARFLEIDVRLNGNGQPYTTLTPRQAVTSTPYAVKSLNADNATTANNSLNLGGVPAAQYVVTSDPRMSDERNPLPGSANYIQNATDQQTGSNFNISGEGKANKFTSVFVNATSAFQQGGARVLQFNATKSGFVGVFTGTNTTGADNMFVGFEAGNATTTGSFNAFLGSQSGKLNSTGFNNSFFGAYSGRGNTTGTNNAYFGVNTGLSSNGSFNSFFGSNAGFTNTSGADNSFFGNAAGLNNQSGGGNSFFGRSAGENVVFAGNNSIFGAYAGKNTTTGGNSYFGASAGQKNTTGFSNVFVGANAGIENTGGSYNTYVGTNTGQGAGAIGDYNTVIGYNAKIGSNVTNATAIGANALATQSNTMVLGNSSVNVIVNNDLEVGKNLNVSSKLSVSGSSDFEGTLNANSLTVAGSSTFNNNVTINSGLTAGVINSNGNGLFEGSIRAGSGGLKGLWNGGSLQLCYVDSGGYHNIAFCSSSRRYKDNIQNFTGGLNIINRLRPVTFTWKSNNQDDVGFVAEEVNQIEPLLSTYNDEGTVEGVKYAQITTALVNAVKEQQEQIKRQQEQIEALKALICSQNLNAMVCQSPATAEKK